MESNVLLLDADISSAFAKIDKLKLLKKLFSDYEILIAPEVYEEIIAPLAYNYSFPLKIIESFNIAIPGKEDIEEYKKLLLETDIGKGELESIIICRNRNYIFASMDSKALNFAKEQGVKTLSLHSILKSFLISNILTKEDVKKIIREIEEKDKTTILNQECIFE